MSVICSIQNYTCPGQFSTLPAQNTLALVSGRALVSLTAKVRINNIAALVQTMAWRRPGDKPLSEPMMVGLLMYICVTRPQ